MSKTKATNAPKLYAVAFMGTALKGTITPSLQRAREHYQHAAFGFGANPDNYKVIECDAVMVPSEVWAGIKGKASHYLLR